MPNEQPGVGEGAAIQKTPAPPANSSPAIPAPDPQPPAEQATGAPQAPPPESVAPAEKPASALSKLAEKIEQAIEPKENA